MKYLIKCSYCGNTYPVKVRTGTTFLCKFCGGANGFTDIIKQIDEAEEEIERQKAAEALAQKEAREKASQRAENLKNLYDDNLKVLGNDKEGVYSIPESRFSLRRIHSIIPIHILAIIVACLFALLLFIWMGLNYRSALLENARYDMNSKSMASISSVLAEPMSTTNL